MSQKKDYLKISEQIAREAHCGQERWNKDPYIVHPQRLAALFGTPVLKSIAWLHDVIEDTSVSLRDLENFGIPGPALSAVKAITKHEDEEYIDYIKRVAKEPNARKVKIKDIEDNLNSTPPCSKQRANVYKLAKWILELVEAGELKI